MEWRQPVPFTAITATKGTVMRNIRHATRGRPLLAVSVLALLLLPGCVGRSAKDNTSATMRAEVAELAKLYRQCLQKYEDTPDKAKANCGVYRDAIGDLAAEGRREMIPDLLDRLSDRLLF